MSQAELKIATLVQRNLAFHSLNKALESRLGLSLVQFYVLSHLRDMPGSSPQQLARAVRMHPSTLTQSLKRLRKKDALFVGEDPKDSRKKILSVTRSGVRLLETFLREVDSVLKLAPWRVDVE